MLLDYDLDLVKVACWIQTLLFQCTNEAKEVKLHKDGALWYVRVYKIIVRLLGLDLV